MRELSVIETEMVSGGADENEAGEGQEEDLEFPDVNEDSREDEAIEDLMEEMLNDETDSEWQVEYDEDNDMYIAISDDLDIIEVNTD